MCTEPVDEQERTAVQDISLGNQIQISIHIEAGVRHLKSNVLVARAVIKLDWKKHTEWVEVMTSLWKNYKQRECQEKPAIGNTVTEVYTTL